MRAYSSKMKCPVPVKADIAYTALIVYFIVGCSKHWALRLHG